MTTAFVEPPLTFPLSWTFGDIQQHLGGIPGSRVRVRPTPGQGTVRDVIEIDQREGRGCELIDGVIVEKTVGYFESALACVLIRWIGNFIDEKNLGIVLGEAGTLRILPGQVRIPDVCFISWDRIPNRELPSEPVPAIVPDLVIEIISPGNTPAEMERKLSDYFEAGVRLVWYIDSLSHSARAWTSIHDCISVDHDGFLEGGDVLPGFRVSLRELFVKASGAA